jgi:hypothetical protein
MALPGSRTRPDSKHPGPGLCATLAARQPVALRRDPGVAITSLILVIQAGVGAGRLVRMGALLGTHHIIFFIFHVKVVILRRIHFNCD